MASNSTASARIGTKRFGEKRQAIINAASVLINERGVQATTLSKVAAAIGLNATSVTYYFARKEQLVVAVYEQTLDRMERMAADALTEADPAARLRHYLAAHVALRTRIREGETGLLTALSEIRSLDEDAQAPLLARYGGIVGLIRRFFALDGGADPAERRLNSARAHILLETMMWWPVWSLRYSILDFPRVEDRLFEVLAHGIPTARGRWDVRPLAGEWRGAKAGDGPGSGTGTGSQNDEFLRAATMMINRRGYRGASVNRIAESLNVTKGSFYHHHDAKDDLVLDCFQRSYDRLSAVQMAGQRIEGDCWTQLSSILAELADLQFRDPMPLLRTTALQTLEGGHRADVVTRSDRLARRFAGLIIDGITDGSMKTVDPLIASQVIMSALNGAFEARLWADRFEDDRAAIYTYLSAIHSGLL